MPKPAAITLLQSTLENVRALTFLSTEKIATSIGVNQSTLYRWLNGEGDLTQLQGFIGLMQMLPHDARCRLLKQIDTVNPIPELPLASTMLLLHALQCELAHGSTLVPAAKKAALIADLENHKSVQKLISALENGATLLDAVKQTFATADEMLIITLRVADKTGETHRALREYLAALPTPDAPRPRDQADHTVVTTLGLFFNANAIRDSFGIIVDSGIAKCDTDTLIKDFQDKNNWANHLKVTPFLKRLLNTLDSFEHLRDYYNIYLAYS